MALNTGKNPWPYLLVRMFAISFIVTPILTGLFTASIEYMLDPSDQTHLGKDFSTSVYLVWGYTLFSYTWAVFLFVLLPYNLIYYHHDLREKNLVVKFLLFYTLLLILGLIIYNASIVKLYQKDQHLRILPLYFLLTVTICPLCNLALNSIMNKAALDVVDS